jgi:DNA invertase Pin-like site-specific DNA recombinase
MPRYGYIRLDDKERDVGRQAAQLDTIGGFDRILVERPARAPSGAPQWDKLVGALAPGDLVVVAAADRIADSARRFLEAVDRVTATGAHLSVLEEGIDTRSATGRHILRALASLVRMEREGMSQRKKEGIREARAQGRRVGRPPLPQPSGFREVCREWSEGRMDFRRAVEASGMRTTSFYKKAKELGFLPPAKKSGAGGGDLPGKPRRRGARTAPGDSAAPDCEASGPVV